jgi:hypothetical protein
MSHIRVVFTGQGPSGLPVDRTVNVWHFEGPGSYVEDVDNAISLMNAFYTQISSTQVNPIGYFLSPWVARAATRTAYNMDAAIPRVPTTEALTLPTSGGANGLPNEVAVCLSFEGAPPHTARRRGRVYIGPLWNGAGVSVAATSASDGRVSDTLIHDLTVAADLLMLPLGGVVWVIRSSLPTPNYVPVVSGWVDNAFDTQRRRGQASTARTVFDGI